MINMEKIILMISMVNWCVSKTDRSCYDLLHKLGKHFQFDHTQHVIKLWREMLLVHIIIIFVIDKADGSLTLQFFLSSSFQGLIYLSLFWHCGPFRTCALPHTILLNFLTGWTIVFVRNTLSYLLRISNGFMAWTRLFSFACCQTPNVCLNMIFDFILIVTAQLNPIQVESDKIISWTTTPPHHPPVKLLWYFQAT